MSVTCGFYLHPASPLHDTGWDHPEHQGRLRALSSTVGRDLIALHGAPGNVEHQLRRRLFQCNLGRNAHGIKQRACHQGDKGS